MATASHVTHLTWNGLITFTQLIELGHVNARRVVANQSWNWDASLLLWKLAEAFKHSYLGFTLHETVAIIIHYCYRLMLSGKWRPNTWYRKRNIPSFLLFLVKMFWPLRILFIMKLYARISVFFKIMEGKLIFCCTGSRKNYSGSVSRQNNNNNPKLQCRYI